MSDGLDFTEDQIFNKYDKIIMYKNKHDTV